jgi:hypothetical protein
MVAMVSESTFVLTFALTVGEVFGVGVAEGETEREGLGKAAEEVVAAKTSTPADTLTVLGGRQVVSLQI